MSLRGAQRRSKLVVMLESLTGDISHMKKHEYAVYIMTNKSNTTFYVGVTSELENRVWKHKNKVYEGFTSKYDINKLVYYEEYQWVQDAIAREKQLKGGSRQKKIDLIVSVNPG